MIAVAPTRQRPTTIPPAFLSTRAYLASLRPGDLPTRCPWLGHDTICPSFERGRVTYLCCSCNRELTPWPE